MAEATEHDLDHDDGLDEHPLAAPTNGHREDAGPSLLDGLVKLREERGAATTFDLSPDDSGVFMASYKLLGPKHVIGVMRATADPSLSGAKVTARCAEFLAAATIGLWLRDPATHQRQEFAGFTADEPAGWLDLPPKLVPPRPLDKPHTTGTAIRAFFANDNTLCAHALTLAGRMQGAQAGEQGDEDEDGFEGEAASYVGESSGGAS